MATHRKEASNPRICLEMLGSFRVTDAAGKELGPFGRSAEALIAHLALAGSRPVSRDRLATLLWPDRPPDQGRHSLRQTLLVARRILDAAASAETIIEHDGLQLNRDVVSTDVERFEAGLASGDADGLRQVLALYRGPLLDHFDARSSLFEDWLIPERARLHEKAMAAFERAVAERAATGDREETLALAERALALDPCHEAMHRTLIALYIEAGRREAALRQFEHCREILKRQLDVELAPETVALRAQAETMRARPTEPIPTRRTETPAASPSPAPLPPDRAVAVPDVPGAVPTIGPPSRSPPTRWGWRRQFAFGAIIVGCLAIAAGFLLWQAPWEADTIGVNAELPPTDKPSLAVLPLRAGGDVAGLAAFADGITEGVNASLLVVSRIFVISRFSILALGAEGANPIAAAKQLHVRYLLDGTVQQERDQLRVTVNLTDAESGRYKWAREYNYQRGEVFKVQDKIVQEIITELQVSLTEGEQERLRLKQAPRNLEAWLRVGEALQALRRLSYDGNLKARGLYEETIALDPNDSGAVEGLAWTHYLDARFRWSAAAADSMAKAEQLAEQAIALDPGWGRTYALLGQIQLLNNDLARALALGDQAIALRPNDSEALALLANTLTYAGEIERAENLMHEAMRLSPYYPDWYAWNLGRILRLKGSHREAIAALESRLTETPGSIASRVEFALAQYAAGEHDHARETAQGILRAFPVFSIAAWYAAPRHRDPSVPAKDAEVLRRLGLPE